MLITIQDVVVMNRLYEELYLLYSNELLNLNIGYDFNKLTIQKMMNIIGDIVNLNIYNYEEIRYHK